MQVTSPLRDEWIAINAMVRKRWQISLRYPLSFAFWTLSPILFILPMIIYSSFISGGRYNANLLELTGTADVWLFVGIGLVTLRFMLAIMWESTYTIREEELLGTLEAVYTSPISRFSLILGNTLFSAERASGVLAVQLIAAWFLFPEISAERIGIALIYVVIAVVFVQGLAMFLAGIVLTLKQGWKIIFTFEMFLSIITPSAFPLAVLPAPLQAISKWSPFTIIIEGFRNTLLLGPSPTIVKDIMTVALMSVIVYFIGVYSFNRMEQRLRTKGLIGKY